MKYLSITLHRFISATTVPPDLTQRLSNVEARQGDRVRFEVKAVGVPTPRIKWYREVR